jgi:hypothetical protein
VLSQRGCDFEAHANKSSSNRSPVKSHDSKLIDYKVSLVGNRPMLIESAGRKIQGLY